MPASIHLDRQGPDWPLGFLNVQTPGIPVGFMSVVDPQGLGDPASPYQEYTVRAEEIVVQAVKPGTSHGTQLNTGNVYIVRKGVQGSGNRDDTGSIVVTVYPGQTLFLTAAALNRNVWSPYRYSVDADNAGDGVFVTLVIQ